MSRIRTSALAAAPATSPAAALASGASAAPAPAAAATGWGGASGPAGRGAAAALGQVAEAWPPHVAPRGVWSAPVVLLQTGKEMFRVWAAPSPDFPWALPAELGVVEIRTQQPVSKQIPAMVMEVETEDDKLDALRICVSEGVCLEVALQGATMLLRPQLRGEGVVVAAYLAARN